MDRIEVFEPEKAKEAMIIMGKALKSMEQSPLRSDAITAYVQLIKCLGLAKQDYPTFIDILNRIERGEDIKL